MEDRVAVVTGSTKGWGRAVAQGLASSGSAVLVNGTSEDVGVVVESIRESGGRAEAARFASDTPEGVNRLMDVALETFGRIDVWVNSLGVQDPEPLLSLDFDSWNRILRIQLTAVFLGTQRAAQEMIRQGRGGRILNVVGGGAYGIPGASAHAASKGGALAGTYSWAAELLRYGITVNGIRGGVQSPGMRVYMDKMGILGADVEADSSTLRQLGFYEVEEAAPLPIWLASEAAADITGFHIGIDGPRITVYDRVSTAVELVQEGGWTVQSLDARLRPALLELPALSLGRSQRRPIDGTVVGFQETQGVGQD